MEKTFSTLQQIKSILVPVIFNIVLPTVDVITDARLIILLFLGAYTCTPVGEDDTEDYLKCEDDLDTNCTKVTTANDSYADYLMCYNDPAAYCTNRTTIHDVCGGYVNHPRWATVVTLAISYHLL